MNKDINIIEYDECVYAISTDMKKYIFGLMQNELNKDGYITEEETENIKNYIDILVDLHNNCCGMVKLYNNPMCGLCVEEIQ